MKMDFNAPKPYIPPSFGDQDVVPLDPVLEQRLKRPIRQGAIVVGVFVVGLTLFAAVAKIDSAVVAHATVRVEDNRKTVRHREGGTVKQILVKEGQHVKQNQVLLTFDEVQPKASTDVLQNQYDSLLAQSTRFQAEVSGQPAMTFPQALTARANDPRVAGIIRDQELLFTSRLQFFETQTAVLSQKLQQIESQIGGVQVQIDSVNEQTRLIKEELDGFQTLYEKGYAPKTRILAYQRTLADLGGRKGSLAAEMNRLGEQKGETRLQMTNLKEQRISQAAEGLRQMQTGLSEVTPKLTAATQTLQAATVRSPADGYVLDLTQFTIGGVVAPGERLLSVVPADAPLIVTARIRPQDIDVVKAGMEARVRLSAFNARRTPPVNATVITVSADQLVDEKTGESYFRADLKIPPQELAKLPKGDKLSPGMPAEAMIVTGNRSILSYIVSPFTDTIRDALRED